MATVQKGSKINFYKMVNVADSKTANINDSNPKLTEAGLKQVQAINNLGATVNSIAKIVVDIKKIELHRLDKLKKAARDDFKPTYATPGRSIKGFAQSISTFKAPGFLKSLAGLFGNLLKLALLPVMKWIADPKNQNKIKKFLEALHSIFKAVSALAKFSVGNVLDGLYDMLRDDATWWERLVGFGKFLVGFGTALLAFRWLNPFRIGRTIGDLKKVLTLFRTGLRGAKAKLIAMKAGKFGWLFGKAGLKLATVGGSIYMANQMGVIGGGNDDTTDTNQVQEQQQSEPPPKQSNNLLGNLISGITNIFSKKKEDATPPPTKEDPKKKKGIFGWGFLGLAAGGLVTSPMPSLAQGGWIQGPQSGYPVSLDGSGRTDFIGHGTEYVARRADGGAFVIPHDTYATRTNPHLTAKRMQEAASMGFGFEEGGMIGRSTKALLDTIAYAEGTSHMPNNGYNTHFGNSQTADLSKHPNKIMRRGGYQSAAFGRYQFMPGTWKSVGGGPMTPDRQDWGATRLVLMRLGLPQNAAGAKQLEKLLAEQGLGEKVVDRLAPEWASFPNLFGPDSRGNVGTGTSYYGQGGKSYKELQARYMSLLEGDGGTGQKQISNIKKQNVFQRILGGLGSMIFGSPAQAGTLTSREKGEDHVSRSLGDNLSIATHPETGKGYQPAGQVDQNGRPVVLSKPAAESFIRMMQDSKGVVSGSDVASSGRSRQKNKEVKGHSNSHHLYGEALDIHGRSGDWIKANGAKYGWKWASNYQGHSGHFSYQGKGAGSTPILGQPGRASSFLNRSGGSRESSQQNTLQSPLTGMSGGAQGNSRASANAGSVQSRFSEQARLKRMTDERMAARREINARSNMMVQQAIESVNASNSNVASIIANARQALQAASVGGGSGGGGGGSISFNPGSGSFGNVARTAVSVLNSFNNPLKGIFRL